MYAVNYIDTFEVQVRLKFLGLGNFSTMNLGDERTS